MDFNFRKSVPEVVRCEGWILYIIAVIAVMLPSPDRTEVLLRALSKSQNRPARLVILKMKY